MSEPMSVHDRTERNSGYAFILIFTFMALGVMLTGYLYYRTYERNFRANVESQLSSIADLKVGELALWRSERLGDGAVLFKNPVFSALVRRFLENPEDAGAESQLHTWMGKYITAYQYAEVSLYDNQGYIRMSAPKEAELVDFDISHNAAKILREGKVVFQDFHRESADGLIHLGVVVPIYDEADESRPLGVLLLDINPATYLYPFIAKWPTPTQTGETLIIRKDGDDVLFLSELRFHKNAPLNRRIPLTKTEVPAVKAALGQTGIVEGVDYRGEPVVAVLVGVPGSPWAMVARMNISEVYAPLKERLWQTLALVGFLLLGAGAAMDVVWRQRGDLYREREKAAEALRQSEARFHQLADATFEGVLITENGRILDANNSFLKMGGYEKIEEVIGRSALEFVAPEYRDLVAGHISTGYDKPYEIVGVKKDGSTNPLEVRGRTMDIAGRRIRFTAVQDITERKKAELKADSMIRRNQVLMQNALEGIHILDEQGNLVEVNDSFCRHLGYTMEEALQLSVTDWEAKYSAEELQARMKIFLDSHAVFESVHRRKDGSLIDVEVSVVGVEFDGRKYLYATNRDITERKLAEEALRKSENKYRTLVENIPQKIFYKDRNSVYVSCNKNYADYLRIGVDEIVGKTDFDLHPKEFAEKYIADDQRLMGLGQTEEIEERYPEDGQEKWAYTVKTPIKNDSGAVIGILGIFWDITDRRLAEYRLRRSESLLAEAQKVARIGHWEWDIKNGLVIWSDEMFRIHGYDPGAITPSMVALMDTVPPEDRERVERIIKQSLDGGRRYFMDRVAVRPDGTRRIVHAEGEVERDESGAPLRMFAVVQDVTESRLMEERLQTNRIELKIQNEELLRTQVELEGARAKYYDLYNLAPVGYFTISGQGLVLEVNLTAANLLCIERNLLVNTPFTRLIVPDDQDTYYLFRKKLFKTGKSQVCEVKMARQDGSIFWVRLEATVANDGESEAPALHVVISDITERKKAELKADSMIRRHQILMQNALEGIHILDDQGNLVEANESFCRHLGYTMAEALQLKVWDWEAKFSADELRVRIKQFLDTRGMFESVHRRKDGSLVDVEVSLVGVELDGRKYIYCTNRDITERKRAESQRKLFREVLDLSSDAVLILDGDTARPVDFNPVAYKQLGYTPREMFGLTVFDIIVAEPGEFTWKDRVKQVKESGGLIVERNHRKKDGSLVAVESSLSVAEVGGKDYMVAVVRDIAERSKIHEMEVTAKSLELTNRELKEFAHVASHDMQEPLRTIIAFSDRLEAKFGAEFSPKALDYLRRIRSAGERMSNLLKDLLRYSLVSGGQLNFDRVDLNQLVADLLEDMRGNIEESGARLNVGHLPVVSADALQMRQLFQNLISNAIKYCKPGEPPEIRIYSRGIKAPLGKRNAVWEITVEDDGIGFNNEYAEKIFKIFERLHGHSEYEGTGVGLATVRKIVERHGWTIKAEGEPGVGAKFTILVISLEA